MERLHLNNNALTYLFCLPLPRHRCCSQSNRSPMHSYSTDHQIDANYTELMHDRQAAEHLPTRVQLHNIALHPLHFIASFNLVGRPVAAAATAACILFCDTILCACRMQNYSAFTNQPASQAGRQLELPSFNSTIARHCKKL